MNKTNLKRYAPHARKDFIAAVTARAQLLGLTEVAGQPHAEPCQVNGDVAVIAGRPWPASVQGKRDRLLQRMKRDGYAATLEAVAYTWFNRFAALRYMELHDYLGHGRRVLSNPDGALPEVLSHAVELAEAGDLPGLQLEQVRQFKLDNQDGELFRRVLIAQCNALHGAMPFLFESIDDETELLLPDNLLLSDSVIAKLVSEIPEEDWSEVEAIGWLYQFYISEKKEQVIGKVVKSEDIPAATQLFTPNWIVQYLVQNSVGRLWLMANPSSTLASQWPYYIQPADQTPEVQAKLDALIQTRICEDGEALNPETITVLDPACGSGHILVVAYDVLKAIYLERGYQPRAIPRLILEKNLHGLDIDDRAAQLAAFALLMKARADDRRLFNDPPKLNVLSLQESKDLEADELSTHLAPFGLQRTYVKSLLDTFEHAKTFGSLIQIPDALNEQLPEITGSLKRAEQDGDLYAQRAAKDVLPLVYQALILGMKFDAIAQNPPYMGSQFFTPQVKTYLAKHHAGCDKDLFSAFISRAPNFCKKSGYIGIVTSFTWMFISSFEALRAQILKNRTLESLVQLEYDSFEEAKAHLCTFVFSASHVGKYAGSFVRLADFKGAENQGPKTIEAINNRGCGWFFNAQGDDFWKIPGSPISYWLSREAFEAFEKYKKLSDFGSARIGMATGKNDIYVRYWYEVRFDSVGLGLTRSEAKDSKKKWFPYAKGGGFRRWYGNVDMVVNWENDGEKLRTTMHPDGKRLWAHNFNLNEIFKPAICWNVIASTENSFRFHGEGFLFDSAAGMLQANAPKDNFRLLGLLNSKVSSYLLPAINPTINLPPGYLGQLPVCFACDVKVVEDLVDLSRLDWGFLETSWSFDSLPTLSCANGLSKLEVCWSQWRLESEERRARARLLEVENNRQHIQAYNLNADINEDVSDREIGLLIANREKDCQRLLSYVVGCMMGRYSLDEPGLIYAHAGNVGFDPSRYEKKFPADADGIVLITAEQWFEDDASSRVCDFLRAVWGGDTLEENKAWLAESLGAKGSERPDETIRRYLADKFFKDHVQTYKKRPIYWLFSSGKQGAFQALVYLHRYHEGTLARMRSEYVLPLTSKMQARMERLEVDIRQAGSTAARNKSTKQLDALRKQHHELLAYDEKLRHYADQRIAIDLDDGVKVNYGKFGDLLAEVKTVTGGAADE